MLSQALRVALSLAAFSGTALAQGPEEGEVPIVAETLLMAYITAEDGTETGFATEVVPLIPGRSCFHWYIRLDPAPAADVKYTERYQLPAPAEFGSPEGGQPPDSIISPESDAIESKMVQTPEEGWISHGWCLTEGDPLGTYAIEVIAWDQSLHRFEFEVVAEEDFEMPDLGPELKNKVEQQASR